MKNQAALNWLTPLVFALALAAACAGLFVQGGERPYTFVTARGQSVQMFGRGLYRYDSLFAGAGFRGTDAVMLVIVLPLLAASDWRRRRGSQDGELVMMGALFTLLYYGISMLAGAAFNRLFLVYTGLFSASLFAVVFALAGFDTDALARRVRPGFPHGGLAGLLFVAGLGTFFLWMSELAGPLLSGQAPELLGPYTTLFTHGFDSAVITPAAVLAGVMTLRRQPLGYLLAAPLLILCTLNGAVVLGQTISQALAGLVFPIGVYIGMVGSWAAMGAAAVALLTAYFRHLAPLGEGGSR